jgi:hypothetical protein
MTHTRLLACAFAVAVAGSCTRVPLVAPSGTAITLIAATNVLPVNGSTDVTAILIEGGGTAGAGTAVHNGTVVTFTTTLGRLEPAEAKTTNGRVTVKLWADGRSGTATVTAFSGPASQTAEVRIGSAAAARVLVSAAPQALPAAGGTSTITARVEDQQGNGLAGVPVTFSTTAGTLAQTNVLSIEGGTASTTLQTSAAATVTASAGGGTSGTLSGTVAVTIRPRTTVSLTPPASVTVSVPASFTIGVGANTVITDVVIDFGDGTSRSLGALSSNTSVQHLFGFAGATTVRVTATDTDGIRTTVSTDIIVVALTATGAASPASTALGGSVLFTVTLSATGASIDGFDWDLGDGRVVTNGGSQLNHIYSVRGTHTVTVRVRPTEGEVITVLIQCVIS